jgi:hypothetical protein
VRNVDANKPSKLALEVNFYPKNVDRILAIAPKKSNKTTVNNVDNNNTLIDSTTTTNDDNPTTQVNNDTVKEVTATPLPEQNTAKIVMLRIYHINSIDQHVQVIHYLKTLSVVTDVELDDVNKDSLQLELHVLGGQDALIKALKGQQKLTIMTDLGLDVEGEGTVLNYRWNEDLL